MSQTNRPVPRTQKSCSSWSGWAAAARHEAILQSPEALGRELLASNFAFNTNLTADEAIELLRAGPRCVQATILLTAAGKRRGLRLSPELFAINWDAAGHG